MGLICAKSNRRIEFHAIHLPLATTEKGLSMAQFRAAATGPPDRSACCIIPPPLSVCILRRSLYLAVISKEILHRLRRSPRFCEIRHQTECSFYQQSDCIWLRLAPLGDTGPTAAVRVRSGRYGAGEGALHERWQQSGRTGKRHRPSPRPTGTAKPLLRPRAWRSA